MHNQSMVSDVTHYPTQRDDMSANTRNNTLQLSTIIKDWDKVKSQTRRITKKMRYKKKKILQKQNQMKNIIRISQKEHLGDLGLPFL